ncbi:MAG: sodium:solute symporter [Flavobacteriales bacterium]|nr:sodium:solute symporter [Flavobacteriales bacterium]
MHPLDWTILLGTLGLIVGYGVWRTRGTSTSEGYLRGGSDNRWWAVGLSVMATQASAITFLSTPGQGFTDGMGFVQFYFGLPLAMIVINRVFIPLYYKMKVFTAYEYIGKRFDGRTRLLAAGLFLIQRGLAAGITIYAPSIILSQVLHWPLSWTCAFIGVLVIIYTTTGGAKAVGVTHKHQMAVIFLGLLIAFGYIVHSLSPVISFGESLQLAKDLGKLDVIDTSFNPSNKYTLWSGLIGGFFLQLAYFGTDQSQVQRYLSGKNVEQAKRGLWMNAVLKIPMQFFILLIGVLVFVFYLFNPAPVHWNAANVEAVRNAETAEAQRALSIADSIGVEGMSKFPDLTASRLRQQYQGNTDSIAVISMAWVEAQRAGGAAATTQWNTALTSALDRSKVLHERYQEKVKIVLPKAETNDKDYIFITFIMDHLPVGIIGLLLAMIFSAGMSSTSAELSALATTSVVDVVKRERTDAELVIHTKWATVLFGLLALAFAALFSLFENLIQAVNIIGSLFYGTILGIFLVAFFFKRIQGWAVFFAAIIAQLLILVHFGLDHWNVFEYTLPDGSKHDPLAIAFLWYNLLAPAVLITFAGLLQWTRPRDQRGSPNPISSGSMRTGFQGRS